MHVRLKYLALVLLFLPIMTAVAETPDSTVTASSYLDTSWDLGLGPRIGSVYASRRSLEPARLSRRFAPQLLSDNDKTSAWVSQGPGPNEWLRFDLSEPRFIRSIEVTGQAKADRAVDFSGISVLSISGFSPFADQPSQNLSLGEDQKQTRLDLNGRTYSTLSLTVEQVYGEQNAPCGLSEVHLEALDLMPSAVSKALELPENASMMAVKNQGAGSQYIVAWSAIIAGQLNAELVGMDGSGDSARVRWRTPIVLQYPRGSTLELSLQQVNFGGPPSILLTYNFIDEFVRMSFARVYILGSSGATPAWEGRKSTSNTNSHLRFGGGKIYVSSEVANLGYRMIEQVYKYNASYRQFEPAASQSTGLRASGLSNGQKTSSPMALFDENPATGWVVDGHGEGTLLTLTFDRPRRIAAVQVMPGSLGPEASQSTWPNAITLRWPGGYEVQTELDHSPELQTIYEGWDGPGAEPTTEITLRVDSVHGGLPGKQLLTAAMEVYFLDGP